MKILASYRSSRDPEKVYYIREFGNGEIVCDCPACEHGGQCYEKSKVRTQREYALLLKAKVEQNPNPLPNMADLREKQWAYIEERKRAWLLKYPDDAILPQYRQLAEKMRRENQLRNPVLGVVTPEQITSHRQQLLRIKRLFDSNLSDSRTVTRPKSNGTESESCVPPSYSIAQLRSRSKSPD